MQPFTAEAAEQIISILCYSRTEDTYRHGPRRKHPVNEGAFRLSVRTEQDSPRLVLSDRYDPAEYRTTTVAAAIQQGLLAPSWEDLATKLYLNDQDILFMCLMSHDEPACLRFIEIERIKAYRDQHNDRVTAGKLTYMPRSIKKHLLLVSSPAGRRPGNHGLPGMRLHKRA
jgi:hypothetical protein